MKNNNDTSKLEKLVSICKGSVHIEANAHTTNYETVEEYVHWRDIDVIGDIDPEKILWEVQAYPRTPVGFVAALGNDLDKILDEIIEASENY